MEENIKLKRERFFRYLTEFMEKDEKSELINLTEIYHDHNCPKYNSPRRILHYPRGKELIRYEIERNAMRVEAVIKYDGKTVYGNYNLAMDYLQSIDAFNKYMFIDMLMKSEPDIVKKFLKL